MIKDEIMGFFEGFRAAMNGNNEQIEMLEAAYQRFAENQPRGTLVTVFDGYRSYSEVPVEKMIELLPDGSMFFKFSGNELPWREKTKILARAIDRIEKQPHSIKREPDSPLSNPCFEWNEEEEKQRLLLESLSLKVMYKTNPNFAAQIDEMGIQMMSDEEERNWLLKTFTGIQRQDIIDWLSTGYEHLMIQFMDIKPDTINENDCLQYLASTTGRGIQKVTLQEITDFRKKVAETQMRLAFMAF
jgi:hypothetical protein